ncbi:hypothetical protein GCM10010106_32710 [Thermopolyspora flexuosa]|nr:hypothetical protein GCM10010106_32710 [Thermopolyspora flexuosa]
MAVARCGVPADRDAELVNPAFYLVEPVEVYRPRKAGVRMRAAAAAGGRGLSHVARITIRIRF